MPQPTQLIFTENPGDIPASYTIPPGLDLELASVVARIDGSAAAGAFLPTLELLSQNGKVMARVRIDQEFAAGDTGVITWAPFLRRSLAQAATALCSERIEGSRTSFQTIGSGAVTNLTWPGNYYGQCGTNIFNWPGGAPFTNPQILVATLVVYVLVVEWAAFAGDRYIEVATTGAAQRPSVFGPRIRQGATPDGDRQFVSGIIAANGNFPVTIQARVFQNSGVNQNVNNANLLAFQLQG